MEFMIHHFNFQLSTQPSINHILKITCIIFMIVNERYQIKGYLGRGSQGTVFDGKDLKTRSRVAIKRGALHY